MKTNTHNNNAIHNITDTAKIYEKSLLACLFVENGAGLNNINLKISDFYDKLYRDIYKSIVDACVRDGQPFDISLITAELKKIDAERDWIVDISELLDFTPNSFNPQLYAEKIKELGAERQRLSLIDDFKNKKIGVEEFLIKFSDIENKEEKSIKIEIENIKDMFIVKPAPLKFIFQGFRESTVGIFAGTGGSGKSYMALAFLLSFADRACRLNYLDLFENNPERRGACGYISLEDDAELIHHRLYNLAKFFDIKQDNKLIENIQIACLYGQNFRLAEKNYNKIIINEQAEQELYYFCQNKKFVVIDTLRRLSNLNENDSSEMSHILRTIEKISYETGCSILINAHTSKADQQGKDKVRGASNITDDTRFTLILDKKMVKNEKGNFDKKQLFLSFEKVNAIKIPEPIPLVWQEWIDEETLETYSMLTSPDNDTEAVSYYNNIENKRHTGRPRGAGKAGIL